MRRRVLLAVALALTAAVVVPLGLILASATTRLELLDARPAVRDLHRAQGARGDVPRPPDAAHAAASDLLLELVGAEPHCGSG